MTSVFGKLLLAFLVLLSGCTTSARFIIPDNTELIVHGTNAGRDEQGVFLTTTPFSWGGYHGVDYQLVDKKGVVSAGTLRTRFRVACLFWPPYAIFYWPRGFAYPCYDLTGKTVVQCPPATPEEKEQRELRAAKEEAKRQARAAGTIGTKTDAAR